MGKQHLSRDDRIFMRGKLQGTRENMDMVAMVLINETCGGVKGGPVKPSHAEVAATLREYAEWADANIYEVPIMLPDDLRTAADMLEKEE